MNIYRQTLLDETIGVERFLHRQDVPHHDPEEERASAYSVSFIEHGRFRVAAEGSEWQLDSRSVFFTRPGMQYRFAHEHELPDDVCFSVSFDGRLAEDVFGRCDFDPDEVPAVRPLTNRLAYHRLRLSEAVEDRFDNLESEAIALEILAAIGVGGGSGALFRPRQLKWYAERIEAIRRLFEARFDERHSLGLLSREFGISAFHLSRVFRELTGMTPHGCLQEIRLDRAASRILDGASVTEVCYECGFANPSHFIRRFKRRFGTTPAQFKNSSASASHRANA